MKGKKERFRKRMKRLDLEGSLLLVEEFQRSRDLWLTSMELARHRNRGDYIR